ncbi:integrase fusion protein, partial [Candidatus Magnetomorum sp. HK-1]
MIIPPPKIQDIFNNLLSNRSVPKNQHTYYKKWFRFYWDFCHKYEHPVNNQKSLSFFTNKLREKKQKEFQIKQAVDAISLYYETIQKKSENQDLQENHNIHFNEEKQYAVQQPKVNQTIKENTKNYSNKSKSIPNPPVIKET